MKVRVSVAAALLAVFLPGLMTAEPLLATERNIRWNKATNFNSLQNQHQKRLPASGTKRKREGTLSAGIEGGAVPKSAAARCEWARAIVSGYAFEKVETRTCDGDVLIFEAMRQDRRFLVEVSPTDGELTKVETIATTNETGAEAAAPGAGPEHH